MQLYVKALIYKEGKPIAYSQMITREALEELLANKIEREYQADDVEIQEIKIDLTF
jgi:hypothetical protein